MRLELEAARGVRLYRKKLIHLLVSRGLQIIRAAVSGMLPKNKLRDRRLSRLKIFAGVHNPYEQNISRRYDVATPVQNALASKASSS